MTDPAHVHETGAPPDERLLAADALVRRYATYSAIGGLIPVPFVDVAAVTGAQLKMLSELCRHYGVPFATNVGKKLIGTLVAVAVPYNLGAATLMGLGPMLRFVPLLGPLVSVAVIPAFAAASTFALGRVFTKHFESGGTLLNFDLESAKQNFAREVDEAKAETSARNPSAKKSGSVTSAAPAAT